nr:MAG TPA: Portal protein, Proximal tail tube, phi29, mature virion, VIRUS.3A [Bacteriophage sp.]
MSRGNLLSILGMYNYDNSIFDELQLPDSITKTDFIQNLCLNYAELELLYSQPEILKNAIGIWSRIQLPNWKKLEETTQYEYNAIENYDRQEEWTDTDSGKETTETVTGGDSTSTNTFNGTIKDNAKTQVHSFDDELSDKDASEQNTKSDNTNTTESEFKNKSNVDNTKNNTGTHNGRIHGNIGTMTTQQMIREEREIVKFNLSDYIMNEFRQRFLITVW